MADEERDPQLNYTTFSVEDLTGRRDELVKVIRESDLPKDALTLAACGLLSIEGCNGNVRAMNNNFNLLLNVYRAIELARMMNALEKLQSEKVH